MHPIAEKGEIILNMKANLIIKERSKTKPFQLDYSNAFNIRWYDISTGDHLDRHLKNLACVLQYIAFNATSDDTPGRKN